MMKNKLSLFFGLLAVLSVGVLPGVANAQNGGLIQCIQEGCFEWDDTNGWTLSNGGNGGPIDVVVDNGSPITWDCSGGSCIPGDFSGNVCLGGAICLNCNTGGGCDLGELDSGAFSPENLRNFLNTDGVLESIQGLPNRALDGFFEGLGASDIQGLLTNATDGLLNNLDIDILGDLLGKLDLGQLTDLLNSGVGDLLTGKIEELLSGPINNITRQLGERLNTILGNVTGGVGDILGNILGGFFGRADAENSPGAQAAKATVAHEMSLFDSANEFRHIEDASKNSVSSIVKVVSENPTEGMASLRKDSGGSGGIPGITAKINDGLGGDNRAPSLESVNLGVDDEIMKTSMAIYQPVHYMNDDFTNSETMRDAYLNRFSSTFGVAKLTLDFLDKTVGSGLTAVQMHADQNTIQNLLKQISWSQARVANPDRDHLYIDTDEKVEACMGGNYTNRVNFDENKCKEECGVEVDGTESQGFTNLAGFSQIASCAGGNGGGFSFASISNCTGFNDFAGDIFDGLSIGNLSGSELIQSLGSGNVGSLLDGLSGGAVGNVTDLVGSIPGLSGVSDSLTGFLEGGNLGPISDIASGVTGFFNGGGVLGGGGQNGHGANGNTFAGCVCCAELSANLNNTVSAGTEGDGDYAAEEGSYSLVNRAILGGRGAADSGAGTRVLQLRDQIVSVYGDVVMKSDGGVIKTEMIPPDLAFQGVFHSFRDGCGSQDRLESIGTTPGQSPDCPAHIEIPYGICPSIIKMMTIHPNNKDDEDYEKYAIEASYGMLITNHDIGALKKISGLPEELGDDWMPEEDSSAYRRLSILCDGLALSAIQKFHARMKSFLEDFRIYNRTATEREWNQFMGLINRYARNFGLTHADLKANFNAMASTQAISVDYSRQLSTEASSNIEALMAQTIGRGQFQSISGTAGGFNGN